MGIEGAFLYRIAEVVIENSKDAYPDLVERHDQIIDTIRREEERFSETIQQGMTILERYMKQARETSSKTLPGELAFRLHDTYGFPLDLTREIVAEEGLAVDEEAFATEMAKQKQKSKQATQERVSSAWGGKRLPEAIDRTKKTVFTGYDALLGEDDLIWIVRHDSDTDTLVLADEAAAGDDVLLLVNATPFYAESGGQTADKGIIRGSDGLAEVIDVTHTAEGQVLHHATVTEGRLQRGERVTLSVDAERRNAAARNHTATHLLHKALRSTLGEHVEQAGSYVSPDRLRFDFHHPNPVNDEELRTIGKRVNKAILANYPVTTELMSIDEAQASGAIALFGEKYADEVRVVQIGDYSRELCGGTHLERTSEACLFRIVSESGIAAGVRRIEALTGAAAMKYDANMIALLEEIGGVLKVSFEDSVQRIEAILDQNRQLEKEVKQEQHRRASGQAEQLIDTVELIGDLSVILGQIHAADAEALREAGDRLRNKLEHGFVLLASPTENKVLWLAMATKSAVASGVNAGKLVRTAAQVTGGGGGGRADMAQAGGKDVSKINDAIAAVRAELEKLA